MYWRKSAARRTSREKEWQDSEIGMEKEKKVAGRGAEGQEIIESRRFRRQETETTTNLLFRKTPIKHNQEDYCRTGKA